MSGDPPTMLEFLSPDLAAPDFAPAETAWRSPLARALARAPGGVEDISRTSVIEVRGEVDVLEVPDAEVVRVSADRAFILCEPEAAAALREALGDRVFAIDLSAAYAGVRVRGERLLRRLTDLDLDKLPALGSIHHVQTLVIRDGDETFRLFFAQEYGHSLAEIVVDAVEGLVPSAVPEGHRR